MDNGENTEDSGLSEVMKLRDSFIAHQLASKPGEGLVRICLPKALDNWIEKYGVQNEPSQISRFKLSK